MIYANPTTALRINALSVSFRGSSALEKLGYKSEFTLASEARKAAKRANLDAFLERRKAEQEKLDAEVWSGN